MFQKERLGAAILVAFLITPLLGLPPTRFGFYPQLGMIIPCIWFLGGCAGLWSCYILQKNPYLSLRIFKMPIVWGPFLLSGLTLGLSIFHPLPLRNWVGANQVPEGILTFLTIGFTSFVAVVVYYMKRYNKLILKVAVGTLVILAILTIIGAPNSFIEVLRGWEWAPLYFDDYLIFIMMGTCGIYLALRSKFHHPFLWDALFILLMGTLFGFIQNSTLKGAAFISIGVCATFFILAKLGFKSWQKIFLALIPIGLMIGITTGIVFYDELQEIFSIPFYSTLESRTNLIRAVYVNFTNMPIDLSSIKDLLIGRGWGGYGDAVTSNLFLIEKVALYKTGSFDPSWEFISRDLMHSHNSLAEIFNALGLLGVMALFGINIALFQSIRQDTFMGGLFYLVMILVLELLWFQLPNTIPFTVLGSAFLLRRSFFPFKIGKKLILGDKKKKYAALSIKVLSFLMMSWALFYGVLDYQMHEKLALRPERSLFLSMQNYLNSPFTAFEALIGGSRQVGYARSVTYEFVRAVRQSPKEDYGPAVRASLSIAQDLIKNFSRGGNANAHTVANNIYGEMAISPETKTYFFHSLEPFQNWKSAAQSLIKFVPFRADILIPHLSVLMERGQEKEVLDLSERILKKDPSHPVALWYKGGVLVGRDRTFQEGICNLQEGIYFGIERFMPIPKDEKEKIMSVNILCGFSKNHR
ncbi:MAG: hypothetical protein JSS34_03955 [Proteobacteria bacterium]|nr:hypothetical protein [Pseudomonadota bacterium]